MSNDSAVEKMIQEKGLTAPRITMGIVRAAIERVVFNVINGSTITHCTITLKNGFTVTGESACASPENFDKELGEKIAKDNAMSKIWAFEAYLLKERMYRRELLVDDIGEQSDTVGVFDSVTRGRFPQS